MNWQQWEADEKQLRYAALLICSKHPKILLLQYEEPDYGHHHFIVGPAMEHIADHIHKALDWLVEHHQPADQLLVGGIRFERRDDQIILALAHSKSIPDDLNQVEWCRCCVESDPRHVPHEVMASIMPF